MREINNREEREGERGTKGTSHPQDDLSQGIKSRDVETEDMKIMTDVYTRNCTKIKQVKKNIFTEYLKIKLPKKTWNC